MNELNGRVNYEYLIQWGSLYKTLESLIKIPLNFLQCLPALDETDIFQIYKKKKWKYV